jgi:drug/metabolite transporter (DMT)-like permease
MSLAVHLALIAVQILFASLAITGRIVLPVFPAAGLALVRTGGAAVTLLALCRLQGLPAIRDRRDLARLACFGLLGIGINQTLYLFGLRHTTAINATILVTTTPVFTVLGSVLLRLEPPSPAKLAGIALAALGSVWLIGPDRIRLDPETTLGNATIVVAMVAYAAYFIGTKPLVGRYPPLTVSAYVMLFGALGVLPVGIPALLHADLATVRTPIWWLIGYTVVGPTVLAYLLNVWALRRASSNVVAVYVYLQPILAAGVAPLVLKGEGLTTRDALAAAVIFAGVGLVLRAERRQARLGAPVPALGE